jgi:hypothetical protein
MSPTPRAAVYRAYWHFAAERQRIFLARVAGAPEPWTEDEILARYKFCNTYRASDRVSQYLIRDVIYAPGDWTPADLVVRIVLFRLFSKPETWQALETEAPLTADFDPKEVAARLEARRAGGDPNYTAAFILCANDAFGRGKKHLNHLALLEMMLANGLPQAVAEAKSLHELYEELLSYPLLGPFMAYQLAIDLNYSPLVDFDEDEFTVPGPGALRGIVKCFTDLGGLTKAEVIHWMAANQESECARLDIELPTLFGRRLHAIDCQGLFCETDKYSRVAFPELKSERVKIKARFSQDPRPYALFYPPKWGLNERLQGAEVAALSA